VSTKYNQISFQSRYNHTTNLAAKIERHICSTHGWQQWLIHKPQDVSPR